MQGLTEVIVANTIPLKPEVADNTTKIKVLSVGPLVAEVTTFSAATITCPPLLLVCADCLNSVAWLLACVVQIFR